MRFALTRPEPASLSYKIYLNFDQNWKEIDRIPSKIVVCSNFEFQSVNSKMRAGTAMSYHQSSAGRAIQFSAVKLARANTPYFRREERIIQKRIALIQSL